MRQQFTSYDRDIETGLDFAQARYYSPTQGRFTAPDPLLASADVAQPQSWNRYTYVENSPLVFVDPSGLKIGDFTQEEARHESIITTGFDPAFGIYRGEVIVEYIGDYSATTILHNPTQEELDQAMDSLVDDTPQLVAQKGGRPPSTRRTPGTRDARRWVLVSDGQGRGQWRFYPNGPSWRDLTGRAPWLSLWV